MNPESRKTILRLTTPVGMGYIPAGFAFGVLAIQAHLPAWIVIAMSVLVYAGAMQYAAIPMLAGSAGLPTVALSTLMINLRHVLYAIALLDRLPKSKPAKSYVIAALTDETYSTLTTLQADQCRSMSWPIALINQCYWVGGTLLGVLLGAQASHWIPHLEFALPALFMILAIEQYKSQRRWAPALVGALSYGVGKVIAPDYPLLIALGLSLLALLFLGGANPKSKAQNKGETPTLNSQKERKTS